MKTRVTIGDDFINALTHCVRICTVSAFLVVKPGVSTFNGPIECGHTVVFVIKGLKIVVNLGI